MGFRVIKWSRHNLRSNVVPAIDLYGDPAPRLGQCNRHIGQPDDGIEGLLRHARRHPSNHLVAVQYQMAFQRLGPIEIFNHKARQDSR